MFARCIPANYHFSRPGTFRVVRMRTPLIADLRVLRDRCRFREAEPDVSNPAFRGLPGIWRQIVWKRQCWLARDKGFQAYNCRGRNRERERKSGIDRHASCVRIQPRTDADCDRANRSRTLIFVELIGTTDCTDSRVSDRLCLPQRDCEYYTTSRLTNVFCVFCRTRDKGPLNVSPSAPCPIDIERHPYAQGVKFRTGHGDSSARDWKYRQEISNL